MKIRELFSGPELGKVVKCVKTFCEKKDIELISKLRYDGNVIVDGIVINNEMCKVVL